MKYGGGDGVWGFGGSGLFLARVIFRVVGLYRLMISGLVLVRVIISCGAFVSFIKDGNSIILVGVMFCVVLLYRSVVGMVVCACILWVV